MHEDTHLCSSKISVANSGSQDRTGLDMAQASMSAEPFDNVVLSWLGCAVLRDQGCMGGVSSLLGWNGPRRRWRILPLLFYRTHRILFKMIYKHDRLFVSLVFIATIILCDI